MIVPKYSGMDSVNTFNIQKRTNVVTGNIKFQQDVKRILETPLGSVLANPTYGSNLYEYLSYPVNDALGVLIQEEVKTRIEQNYKDIVVEEVNVTFEGKSVSVEIGMNNGNSNVLDFINVNFEGSEE